MLNDMPDMSGYLKQKSPAEAEQIKKATYRLIPFLENVKTGPVRVDYVETARRLPINQRRQMLKEIREYGFSKLAAYIEFKLEM